MQLFKTTRHLIIGLLVVATPALADSSLKFVAVDAENKNRRPTTSVYLGDELVRIDDAAEPAVYTLFNPKNNEITIVDRRRKSFTVLDESMLTFIEQQVQMLRKQVSLMPAEQRRELEKMLGMGLTDGPEMTVIDTKKHQQVAGIHCTVKEIRSAETVQHRYCVATAETLGIAANDYKAATSMFSSLQKLAERSGAGNAMVPFSIDKLGGLPIRMHNIESPLRARQELDSISHKPLADEVFMVPQGYTRETPSLNR